MTNDPRNALRAWLDLLNVSGALKKDIDAALRREFGMSISRFDVLATLDRAGPDGLRAGDLAQRLVVTDGAATQVTAPLIRDGLVRRTPCPDDGRAAIFTLTAKGRTVFARMAAANREWIARAFAQLSPAQMENLRRLLRKIDLPSSSADGRNAA